MTVRRQTAAQRNRREWIHAILVDVFVYGSATVLAILALSPARGQEVRWLNYSPAGSVNDRGILEDVKSRLTPDRRQAAYEADPIGWIHEGTHYLNSQLDDVCGPDSDAKSEHCAYVGGGRFVVLRHPRVTLATVRQYVAPNMQGAFDSTLCSWQQWNTEPLYILDEWTAYANGSQACRELRADVARRSSSDQRAQWVGHFAEALVAAVRAHDPGYPQLSDLIAFVQWHRGRVSQLLGIAAMAQVSRQTQCRWVWNGQQWVQDCSQPVQQQVPTRQIVPQQVQQDAAGWSSAGSDVANQVVTSPATQTASVDIPKIGVSPMVVIDFDDPKFTDWRNEHDERVQQQIDNSLDEYFKAHPVLPLSEVERVAEAKAEAEVKPLNIKVNEFSTSLAQYARVDDVVKLPDVERVAETKAEEKVRPLGEELGAVKTTLNKFATKVDVKNDIKHESSTTFTKIQNVLAQHKPGVLAGAGYGKLAAATLGISGPIGIAIIAGFGLAGWFMGPKKQTAAAAGGPGAGGAGNGPSFR